MTITVTPLSPETGDAINLGDDDSGDVIVDPPPLPNTRRAVQTETLAFSEYEFVMGRGNRVRWFSWTVSRQHVDEATAADFVHQHEGSVPVNCSILIDGGDAGTWSYTSAVMAEVNFTEHYGTATTCRYVVTGAVFAAAES